ncbi:hypothetical protein LINGRAPRIM_LOCUS574 [Linum grandiflorum]
MGTTSSP